MPAEFNERIVDDSYKAVFFLNKEQVTSHVCSTSKLKLSSMRVRLDSLGGIITESTDGKIMLQVKETATLNQIEHFPFDVNPSESPKAVLTEPKLIPGETLDIIAKGFPKRKNYQKQRWQKSAVFSFQEGSDDIEVGRSDKQGRATIDKFPAAKVSAFPPIEDVIDAIDNNPTASAKLELSLLKRLVESVDKAGVDYVELSLWASNKPVKLKSVNKWGGSPPREVTALIMPVVEKV